MTRHGAALTIAAPRPPVPGATQVRGGRHMRLTRAVQDYLDDCRVRRRSPATIVTYENALGFLTRIALLHGRDEVGAFTPELVKEYFVVASTAPRANSRNAGNTTQTLLKKRSVLAGFARWGLKRRLWTNDPMIDAPDYLRDEKLPKPYERHERERLLDLPLSTEDTALRAVMYDAGLRAKEIIGLRIADVRFGDGVRAGHLVILHSKRNRERIVPMTAALEAALGDHLMDRRDLTRWVFQRPDGRPFTHVMLRYRVKHWGRDAQVDKAIPHRFRHLAATELLEAGNPVTTVQRFLGHRSITTTMLYARVVDAEVERAVLKREQMQEQRKILRQDSTPPVAGAAEGRVD